jgi:CBS domain-containing protein
MKRDVVSVFTATTLVEAAKLLVQKQIGALPVTDDENKLVGMLGLADILNLFLPDFVHVMENVDFVHDFGVWEDMRVDPATRTQPVSAFMREPMSVEETTGLLRAYTMMLKHDLHDLPVVKPDGTLVGIASRVDIGTAFLSRWGTKPLDTTEMV